MASVVVVVNVLNRLIVHGFAYLCESLTKFVFIGFLGVVHYGYLLFLFVNKQVAYTFLESDVFHNLVHATIAVNLYIEDYSFFV